MRATGHGGLKTFYRVLTTMVGLIGCLLGAALIVVWSWMLASMLSIDMLHGGSFDSRTLKWLGGLLFGILFCIYVGCVLVAALAGAGLMVRGHFPDRRAYGAYVFLSRYPSSWRR